MKTKCLRIFYSGSGGFSEVARLCVRVLKNRVKCGVQKLFLGLTMGENKVGLCAEWAILSVKSLSIMNVYFAKYPLLKVKKANSLYVIIRKE
jgi:hypothetical protein